MSPYRHSDLPAIESMRRSIEIIELEHIQVRESVHDTNEKLLAIYEKDILLNRRLLFATLLALLIETFLLAWMSS